MKLIDTVIGCLYGTAIKDELCYRRVYKYLEKYEKQNSQQELINVLNNEVKLNKTIWVCWLQGLETAPRLIKICYESIKKNKPKSFDLILITYKNMKDYISLPSYILQKHKRGNINRTHLSDIIRTELLCTYGGCWIDATVYCSNKIPEYMLSGNLFTFKWSLMDSSTLCMSSWWIYACREEKIISEVRNILYRYWKNENILRNYFLFHIIFSRVIKNDLINRETFENMPYCNNSVPHILYKKMKNEFEAKEWDIIKANSCVHKLSYKEKYLQGDIYNYYMRLMEGKLV